MHLLLIGLGVLWVVCLLTPAKPSKRVSRLSEKERQAWIERDRLAFFEKERLDKIAASKMPGGPSID